MRYALLWAIALTLTLGGGSSFAIPLFSPPAHPVGLQAAGFQATVGKSFQLKLGERAIVKGSGLTVKFLKVKEDSRCPSTAACVWAGQATIVVNVMKNGKSLGDLELTRGPAQALNTSKSLGGYRVKFMNLSPYPASPQPIQAASYVASFVVARGA